MEGDEDLFPSASFEECQRRGTIVVEGLLIQVYEKLLDSDCFASGRLPVADAEEIKKSLADIDARIDVLKQKIS